MTSDMTYQVVIDKLVFGGQGLATLPDGRRVFVWNALPGETVTIRLLKQKKNYAEAIAETVEQASPDRRQPKDANYLATSPWQIMSFAAENRYKRSVLEELFMHEHVKLPKSGVVQHDRHAWHYRNKMEYSFWGDDTGIHLALHSRGSHGKQIVSGSALALPAIDAAAVAVCQQLSQMGARAGDLKTIIVRCNQHGEAVVALFTKLDQFNRLTLPEHVRGLRVYHSDPRSPASLPTRLLYEIGDAVLSETIAGRSFQYDVDSFFQVNPPLFEKALTEIGKHLPVPAGPVVDMYAGVGSIGLSLAARPLTLVELDPASVRMAKINAAGERSTKVVAGSSESSLNYIRRDASVVFDPPRIGLHKLVVASVLEKLPPVVVYLSCNPATQARDLAKLQTAYKVTHLSIYNFFPRTPHIETLAILSVL
jgi:23S rRNA (uracil1939-C5)-methyltransferase